jgi:hypothetical protein
VVKKYLNELDKHMKKYNAYERIRSLHQEAKYPITREVKEEYEKLDEIREKGMLKAEKKCRKLKMGSIKWSP